MRENKVIIIGGGVIGLSIGWQLAKAGMYVHIFDRGRAGRGASWASAGMLTPLAEVRFQEEELLRLALKSLDLYPRFVEELESDTGCNVGYRRDGVLLVGITPDDVEYLKFRFQYQKELGLPVVWMSGDGAREREPHLSKQVSAAVWCEGDHHVDNRLLVDALKRGVEKAGGIVEEDTAVESIELQGDSVTGVRAAGRPYQASLVVLAAGAWSPLIEGIPNGCRPPVRPVRGQILRLKMTEEVTLKTITWYSRIASSTVAYLVPKDNGQLVLGATSEEMGYDESLTAGGLFELTRAAWEVVPGLYDLPVEESMAGLRPGSRDDAPVLGYTPVKGLVLATGHYRKGILLAPITAYNIRELLLAGRVPAEIEPFGIGRFER